MPGKQDSMSESPLNKFKKGTLLAVKAPPYYTLEYHYEIISCGEKRVRASLYHSPKVRKSWSLEEFLLLQEMGIVRVCSPADVIDRSGAG
jgi:hypothetical protein